MAVPVVQKMAPPGVALVVSSREDAAFGPIVSLGLDGIASELLGDVVYRVPPLTTADAAGMVRDLRAAPLLFGRHGSPGVDVEAVEDLLHRVAQLADDLPQVASLTLHPCIASMTRLSCWAPRSTWPRPPTSATRWPGCCESELQPVTSCRSRQVRTAQQRSAISAA